MPTTHSSFGSFFFYKNHWDLFFAACGQNFFSEILRGFLVLRSLSGPFLVASHQRLIFRILPDLGRKVGTGVWFHVYWNKGGEEGEGRGIDFFIKWKILLLNEIRINHFCELLPHKFRIHLPKRLGCISAELSPTAHRLRKKVSRFETSTVRDKKGRKGKTNPYRYAFDVLLIIL